MHLENILDDLIVKYNKLQNLLNDPTKNEDFAQIAKEYSELTEVVDNIHEYKRLNKEIKDLENLLNNEEDCEFAEIANDELIILRKQLNTIEKELKLALIAKDKDDSRNVILEIRAGTGGDEAALFAADLYRMYQCYAESKNWKFETMNTSCIGIGGYKEASALISGQNVFGRLKFESGVHRVQRVPETESSGRIHTSAATVAILPEAQDIDVTIEEKDLRIDVYRSSGPGGQSVNTTDSAVRIVHIPTGTTVIQQDEKSQHKNREKAMKILRSRLYDMERNKQENDRSEMRRLQIGSGDRSEKIRTYNFPQGRVSDHRINMTLYKIDAILNEGKINEFIDELIAQYEAEKLLQLNNK